MMFKFIDYQWKYAMVTPRTLPPLIIIIDNKIQMDLDKILKFFIKFIKEVPNEK